MNNCLTECEHYRKVQLALDMTQETVLMAESRELRALHECRALRTEIERLQKERDDLRENLIAKYIRQEKEIEHLKSLLSHWYECWNDGIADPDGDVLDDTTAALAGEDKTDG